MGSSHAQPSHLLCERSDKSEIVFSSFICLVHFFRLSLPPKIKARQMMTSMQLQLNSELFDALQVISKDESLMQKAVKALKKIVAQKQAMDETEYLMSSPAMAEIIRQGQEDIKNGKGRTVTLDEIWK
jgi:selenocysteine-specific translation elongation factor